MSRKERDRMTIMTGVKRQELTLVQAGELMAVCYGQSKRIWRRYQAAGDAGLVHRLRGNASRVSGRWCNWTGRTTTGSRGAAPGAC